MKKNSKIIISLVILALSALVVLFFITNGKKEKVESKERLVDIFDDVQVYNSDSLGMKLYYRSPMHGDIVEKENKIFVDGEDGQYIEVFQKKSS